MRKPRVQTNGLSWQVVIPMLHVLGCVASTDEGSCELGEGGASASDAGAEEGACDQESADQESLTEEDVPSRSVASSTPQASSANFIGGTTKQLELETKGRARKFSSPPAIA